MKAPYMIGKQEWKLFCFFSNKINMFGKKTQTGMEKATA